MSNIQETPGHQNVPQTPVVRPKRAATPKNSEDHQDEFASPPRKRVQTLLKHESMAQDATDCADTEGKLKIISSPSKAGSASNAMEGKGEGGSHCTQPAKEQREISASEIREFWNEAVNAEAKKTRKK